MVWLKTGQSVRFSTRVFWRLFRLVSGSTKLDEEEEEERGDEEVQDAGMERTVEG